MIVAGYGLTALGFLGYYFVNSMAHLFIIEFFFGIVTAFQDPAWEAFFSKNLSNHKEAREWGDWESGKYILVGIGSLLGGIVALEFGFKTLFMIMTAICTVSTLVSYMLIKRERK